MTEISKVGVTSTRLPTLYLSLIGQIKHEFFIFEKNLINGLSMRLRNVPVGWMAIAKHGISVLNAR